MENTKEKTHYSAPDLTLIEFRLKDVILTSPESYSQVVIDDGDWGNEGNNNALGDSLE